MMSNVYYSILSQIVLAIWFFIDFNTGQKMYYEATNANVPLEYHDNRIKKFNSYYIFFIIIMFLLNEIILNLFKNVFFYTSENLYFGPALMTTLLIAMGITSLYTDPAIHRVNRFPLRFVYFVNLLLAFHFSFKINDFINYAIPILMIDLIIIFFLLFTNIMGSSDLRAIMAFIPYYIIVFKNFTIYLLVIHFTGIAIGHYLQKRKTKKSVPICHWLIIPAPFFVLIYLIILKHIPSVIDLRNITMFL